MYYPILRWKAGEKLACKELESYCSDSVSPIWMLHNKDNLTDMYKELPILWQGEQSIDISRLQVINDLEPILIQIINTTEIRLIMSIEQLGTVSAVFLALYAPKAFIRIPINEHNSYGNDDLANNLNKLLAVKSKHISIIFDLGYVGENDVANAVQISDVVTQYIGGGNESIIVAGGSFPETLSDIVGIKSRTRFERQLHEHVSDNLVIPIKYSDYGIVSPLWKEIDGGGGSPYVNIRYAMDYEWLIYRDNQRGGEASIALATILLASTEYRGEFFSWGDKRWYNKAVNKTSPGNSMQHMAEAMNHHIVQVLKYG